jgi:helicase
VDHDATLANIQAALKETLGQATADDVVLFSFSGHGSHDHRLAASDTQLSNLPATTIAMAELGTLFKSTRARAVLCILDCCFSGAMPDRKAAHLQQTQQESFCNFLIDKRLASK